MKTIAITNHKGGCGKTTTAVNLAAALAEREKTVLLVDLDAQAHSTLGVGVKPNDPIISTYDVLTKPYVPLSSVILNTKINNLDLAPSNILLASVELKLNQMNNKEFVLKNIIKNMPSGYDYCIIDCSPSLGLLTENAMVACDYVLIPVQAEYYALEGMKQLIKKLVRVKKHFNQNLRIMGMLITFVERRALLSKDVQSQMRKYFKNIVFDTVIHRTIRLAEAPSAGKPVLQYASKSAGAQEYRDLAEEVICG